MHTSTVDAQSAAVTKSTALIVPRSDAIELSSFEKVADSALSVFVCFTAQLLGLQISAEAPCCVFGMSTAGPMPALLVCIALLLPH